MQILIWFFTLLFLLLWTALAAGLHALLAADPAWTAQLSAWLTSLPAAPWIEGWWPGWEAWVVWSFEMVRWALGWAGPLAIAAVWVLWAIVALPLLGLAAGLSLLVRKLMAPKPAAA
jgi:hypothetical protein